MIPILKNNKDLDNLFDELDEYETEEETTEDNIESYSIYEDIDEYDE